VQLRGLRHAAVRAQGDASTLFGNAVLELEADEVAGGLEFHF
jgi:hypothetical protein